MNKEKRYYDNVDLLKAVAILLVITLHLPLWYTDFITTPGSSRVIQFAFRIIAEGVPFFVTINGFLLLQKDSFSLKKHLNKCLHMFLFMVMWGLILTTAGTCFMGDISTITLGHYIRNIFDIRVGAPLTGVLWFLQNLLGVYLVFPVIWKLYHEDFDLFQYFFVILFSFTIGINCLSMVRDALSIHMDVSVMSEMISFLNRFSSFGNEWYLFYFCLGGMMYHYLDKIQKHRRLLSVLGILSWPVAFSFGYYMSVGRRAVYNNAFNYGSIMMLFLIVGMFALTLPFRRDSGKIAMFVSHFGQRTMGIYVVHFVFIWFIRNRLPQEGVKIRVLSYLFVVAASFAFSEICSRNRYLKKMVSL